MPTYRTTVYTGNLSPGAFAGTDSNVYVTLYGTAGSSDELVLDNAGNNFEQAAVDLFSLNLGELGDLQRVRVRHDNTGFGPGWFLDRIQIRNETTDQEWTFPCNRWLARDEDDGEIERMLDRS
jgi:PLAT/LH2 domain